MEKQHHGHASRDSAIPPRPEERGFPRSLMIKAVLIDPLVLINMPSLADVHSEAASLASEAGIELKLKDFYAENLSFVNMMASKGIERGMALDLIHDQLQEKMAEVTLYPDALESLWRIRGMGYQLGICGNVTYEQAKVIRRLIPVTTMVLSCEFGVMKPDHRIFAESCRLLNATGEQVMMIGTSYTEDYLPSTSMGMLATHFVRSTHGESDLAYCIDRMESNLAERLRRRESGLAPWEQVPVDPNEWEARA